MPNNYIQLLSNFQQRCLAWFCVTFHQLHNKFDKGIYSQIGGNGGLVLSRGALSICKGSVVQNDNKHVEGMKLSKLISRSILSRVSLEKIGLSCRLQVVAAEK